MTDCKVSLQAITDSILSCSACNLRHPKLPPVPSCGPVDAEVMIVGEAAGVTELEQGKPFVGKAGYLLNQCLQEAGWKRSELYIANTCRCRPTNGTADRPPSVKEKKACQHFLLEEIEVIKPKLVILLGNTPLSVFSRKSKITEMRGKPFEQNGITFFPTYHPSFILRMPAYRHVFVSDLRRARGITEDDVLDPEKIEVTICRTREEADKCVAEALKAEVVAIDTETTGLQPWNESQRVLCAAVACGEDKTFAIPMTEWGKESLRPLLESNEVKKVFHNAKFDTSFLMKEGLNTERVVFDTSIAAHLLDENRSLKLEHLAVEVLGAKPWKSMVSFEDWQGTVDEMLADPKSDTLMRYNGIDANMTLRLYAVLKPNLLKNEKFLNTFTRISMPLVPVLRDAERYGMMIDVPYLETLQKELEGKLEQSVVVMNEAIPESYKEKKRQEYEADLLDKYMNQITTRKKAEKLGLSVEEVARQRTAEALEKKPFVFEFNWNSGDQLAELFFSEDGLGYEPPKMAESGKRPSTDEESLKAIGEDSPTVAALLAHKADTKFLTTYVKPWQEMCDSGHRLHTSFNITGTVTGRLSSSNPNLQNCPRDRTTRNAFIAPKGWKILQLDYSQLEMRVAAQVAPEMTMRKAYQDGVDLHTLTACNITGKDPKDITKAERTAAKATNFGMLYGISTAGFQAYAKNSYGLNLTLEEAQMFRDRFFQAYPGLIDWHNKSRAIVLRQKYMDTAFGRRRRLPDAASMDMGLRNASIRESINVQVQSVASDLMLISLVRLHELLDPDEARLISTVHDSAMCEVREEYAEMIADIVKDVMEHPPIEEYFSYRWTVPLVADVSIGDRWGEL
jgi:uracil-DNA glycosylase family 4